MQGIAWLGRLGCTHDDNIGVWTVWAIRRQWRLWDTLRPEKLEREFPKIRGTLLWGPYSKDATI